MVAFVAFFDAQVEAKCRSALQTWAVAVGNIADDEVQYTYGDRNQFLPVKVKTH